MISRPSVRLMTRAWVLETVTQSWRHVIKFLGLVACRLFYGSCCSLIFSKYLSHTPQQCVTHSRSLVSMSTPKSTGSSMLAHSGHDVGRNCAAARWPWILRSMLCQTSSLIFHHHNSVLNCLNCILLVLHCACHCLHCICKTSNNCQ